MSNSKLVERLREYAKDDDRNGRFNPCLLKEAQIKREAADAITSLESRVEDLKKDAKLKSDNVNFMCSQQDFIDLMNENERLTAVLDRLGSPEPLHKSPQGAVENLPPLELKARAEYARNRGEKNE